MGYTPGNLGISNRDYASMMKTQYNYQSKLQTRSFFLNIGTLAATSLIGGIFGALSDRASGAGGASSAGGADGVQQFSGRMKADSSAGQKALQEMTSKLTMIEAKISEIDSITGDGYNTDLQTLQASLLDETENVPGLTLKDDEQEGVMTYENLKFKLNEIAANETTMNNNATQITACREEATTLMASAGDVSLPLGSVTFTCKVNNDGSLSGKKISTQLNEMIGKLEDEIKNGREVESPDTSETKRVQLNNRDKSYNTMLLDTLNRSRSAAAAKDNEITQKQSDVQKAIALNLQAVELEAENENLKTQIDTAKESIGYEKQDDGSFKASPELTNAKSKLDGSKRTQSKLDALKAKRDSYKKDDGSDELDPAKIKAEKTPLLEAKAKVEAFIAAAKAAGDAKGKYADAKDQIKKTRGHWFDRELRGQAKLSRQLCKDDKADAKAQMKQNLGPLYNDALQACATVGI